MKRVFQTTEQRTGRHRLARLKERAVEWDIEGGIVLTETQLPRLLPRGGSRRLPTTSNRIERFFGTSNRFAKVRRGFHSVLSTKRDLIVFWVVYAFSQQANGKAPIEAILPEASHMPLYRIFNDPFAYLIERSGGDAENSTHVTEIRGMAEFLTMEEEAA